MQAKAGAGSATLSMAYAAAKFAAACLRGMRGDARVVECSFITSQVTELPFFATKVWLGRTGVEEIFPLGALSEYERTVVIFFSRKHFRLWWSVAPISDCCNHFLWYGCRVCVPKIRCRTIATPVHVLRFWT